MSTSKDRLVLNTILGLIVFVGVSGSVSPWLRALYGWLAIWVIGAGVVVLAIWGLVQLRDGLLDREVRASWKQNGVLARELATKHAAHPEVAKELAERMLAEKLRREQMQVQPPTAPPAV